MTDEYPPFTLLMVCPDHVVRPLSGSTLISEYEKLTTEIKRLEDALVEERAYKVGSMAAMSGRLMDCFEAEKIAREQLRAEGMIR